MIPFSPSYTTDLAHKLWRKWHGDVQSDAKIIFYELDHCLEFCAVCVATILIERQQLKLFRVFLIVSVAVFLFQKRIFLKSQHVPTVNTFY